MILTLADNFPIQRLNTCPLFLQTHNQHFWQSFGCLCQSAARAFVSAGYPAGSTMPNSYRMPRNALVCMMLSFQGHGTRLGLLDSGPDRLCISCVCFIALNK